MSRDLLIIDVQNECLPAGALPITHQAGHLEHIFTAMDAAAGRVPTVDVQHHSPNLDKLFSQKKTPGWELHPEVTGRPLGKSMEKSCPRNSTGTTLDEWRKKRDADTVSIADYMSHMCYDTTVRQKVRPGYNVEFLRDATGTLRLANDSGEIIAEKMQRSILRSRQTLLSEVLDVKSRTEKI